MEWLATLLGILGVTGCEDAASHSTFRLAPVVASGPEASAAEPLRYDATHETSRSRSSYVMIDTIPPEDRQTLESLLPRPIAAYSGELSRRNPEAPVIDGELLMQPLHGLTVDEIRWKVEAEERKCGPMSLWRGGFERRRSSGKPMSSVRRTNRSCQRVKRQ